MYVSKPNKSIVPPIKTKSSYKGNCKEILYATNTLIKKRNAKFLMIFMNQI